MGRTQNSFKSIVVNVIGQLFQVVVQFASRTIFISVLSAEYLGVHGLFTNILSVLSLAELGFGASIIYSMYKPIASENKKEITGLMNLFRRIFTVVAIIIFLIGLTLVPFLESFFAEPVSIESIRLIYLLYLINTVFSYLLIYKKAIIDAHQKYYISTFYKKGFIVLQNILQIIFLILTGNFIVYLLIKIGTDLASNLMISRKADALYPYLKENKTILPDKVTRKSIYKNTYAMSIHKLGSVAVNNTDNIIMSSFISIVSVGIYSNYTLILSNLTVFLALLFNSLTASVGNLGMTSSKLKLISTFKTINFIGFWIYSFSAISLLTLLNPFISLWVGTEYTFSTNIVLILVVNFYINGMRKVPLTFRDALGLFWYDRFKPVFETIINLVGSILLVQVYGIAGIFWGTFLSAFLVSFWVEPYILFKHGFDEKIRDYFKQYAFYTSIFIVSGGFTFYITSLIPDNNWIMFIFKVSTIVILYNLLIIAFFFRTTEFKSFVDIIKRVLLKT
ncbi:lipopolysaccharide biosynthesis protein [Alkalibacterium putridalgicola]|uniref:lipopolysaccharide biosynthesis protein n=1 Tax=Alkalibacterium putridalgicola TaxID=426703 RepID=UPI0034CE3639